MNLLVASKKLKTAISTIANYDLPEDQLLLEISKSLESWIQKNLIVEWKNLIAKMKNAFQE